MFAICALTSYHNLIRIRPRRRQPHTIVSTPSNCCEHRLGDCAIRLRPITAKLADDINHQALNSEASMYSTDIKTCARQMVKENLTGILAGTYDIPSLEEMKLFLEQNFDHSFDEYLITQKIKRSHPEWSNDQVIEELDRQKRHYENELRVNLRIAALNAIEEIENLIISLNNAIREWKVLNL